MEFGYPLRRWWHRMSIYGDPHSFNSFRSMEQLALSHEAHVFCPVTDTDVSETVIENIRGVIYHFLVPGGDIQTEVRNSGPFDSFVVNSDPPAQRSLFPIGPRPRKLIQRYHNDITLFASRIPENLNCQPDVVVPCKPSDCSLLALLGMTCEIDWLPCGVDRDLCHKHRVRWDRRPYDIAVSANYPTKGQELCHNVAAECRKLGLRMMEVPWIYSFSKPELFEILGQHKFIFHPSLLEGASRLLAEAHYCGTRIICSAESGSVLANCVFLNSIPVLTGGRYYYPAHKATFSRDPAEIAQHIKWAVGHYHCEAEEHPMDYYNSAEYETKRFIELVTT